MPQSRKETYEELILLGYTSSKKETYVELIILGYTPQEAWAEIEKMNFAEDEEE